MQKRDQLFIGGRALVRACREEHEGESNCSGENFHVKNPW
jgi:hypothetical protein